MRPKAILLVIGLAVVGLFGCTDAEYNESAQQTQRYTTADSIAFELLGDSIFWDLGRSDTLAFERVTTDMLNSPFARSRLPELVQALRWRTYTTMSVSPRKERYAAQFDSMLADARMRKDTLMLFALLEHKGGLAMFNQRDLAKAMDYREEALRLDPRQVLIEQVPWLYVDMAEAYEDVKQWDRSIPYSAAMVRAGRRSGDSAMVLLGEIYLAAEYQQLGNPDSVDSHLEVALSLLHHVTGYPQAIARLVGIERQRGHYDRAGELLNAMMVASEQIGELLPLSECTLCIMELAWHELHSGHPEKAKAIAATMARDPGFWRYKFALQCYHQVMDSIAVAQGDYRDAYEHRVAYVAIRDSMNLASAAAGLQRIANNYKEDAANALRRLEDQAAANLLQKERTRRNIFLYAGLGLGAFLVVVVRQRGRIRNALRRSDELLLNILPEEVAEELKEKGQAEAKHFANVTILFTDFKGFTEASERMSPQELVEELNTCFKAFDAIITARGIEKIKTIGDAYMCVGGLPDPASSTPADVVLAALEMQAFMKSRKTERDAQGKPAFEMRVGIHSGPVVAGIVGVKKFQYDIWGDTVNTASRMESSGEVGQVNVSGATYALVVEQAGSLFDFTPRGKVQAKGKGELEMWFVDALPPH